MASTTSCATTTRFSYRGAATCGTRKTYVALGHAAEHNVLSVKPGSLRGAQEELRAVGVGASVGHGQHALAGVLQREVLVLEGAAVDGLAARAVVRSEITTLAHCTRHNYWPARIGQPRGSGNMDLLKPGMTRWKLDLAYPKPFSPATRHISAPT